MNVVVKAHSEAGECATERGSWAGQALWGEALALPDWAFISGCSRGGGSSVESASQREVLYRGGWEMAW